MMHTLKFDPWTQQDQTSLVRFVMLYQAFLGTADNPNRSRNIEETRTSILVIDALAKVSDVVNTGQMNETRILKAEGGEVSLDEAAFKLLQRSVDAYVGQVQFAMAKSAMDMKDFVDAAAASK
jgi:hypothetical protein